MNMNMKMKMKMKMMKSSQLSLYSVVLLICMSAASAAEAPDAVVDIEGKQLRAGVEYYILPVVRGRGGGLTMSMSTTAAGNKTCPLDVAQERLEVRNGLPVRFHPVDPKKGVVRVSTDHNIKFSAASICVQSTVWKLDYEESTQKYVVTTGALIEGKPGQGTISNWFKIDKFDTTTTTTTTDHDHHYYYKLVFCPTVCNYCKVICRDVSISVEEDGLRRLIVDLNHPAAAAPFKIMFKEA